MRFELHPNKISQWKQEFVTNSQLVFSEAMEKEKEEPVNLDAVYAKIGQLEMVRGFLKKKLEEKQTQMQRRMMVSPKSKLSIRQHCSLLANSRAWFYHCPKQEHADKLQLMQLMDAHILQEPTARVVTMQSMLKEKGYKAGYERVRRLMRLVYIRPTCTK